jgi:hypothetical protein
MQRQNGEFRVNRSLMIHTEGGNIVEMHELPNGQWQYGKGKDSKIVTKLEPIFKLPEGAAWVNPENWAEGFTINGDLEEIHELSEIGDSSAYPSMKRWVDSLKNRKAPAPVQQGVTPALQGVSSRDQLSQALAVMPNEAIDRLLNVVKQVMEPIADSLKQGSSINSHEDGYGHGEQFHAPASDQQSGFQLPAGATWATPGNPAAGYLTESQDKDDHGVPIKAWHPTPAFHDMTDRPEPTPIAETAFDRTSTDNELDQELAAVRSGKPASGRSRSRR